MKEYNKVKQDQTKPEEKVEEPKQQPVADSKPHKLVAQARPVRKNIFSRVGHAIFGPDGLKGVGRYVGTEIVAPAIKGIIVDSVVASINTIIYGGDAPRTRSTGSRAYGGYTNYNRQYSGSPITRTGDQYTRTVMAANRIQEYELPDRQQANDVLTSLREIADKYSAVSVADYYESIGVPVEYTDNNYGWELRDIDTARVRSTPHGFIIELPRPRSL